MEKKCINVSAMQKAGPYSQAVEAGGFLFLSGVLPVDASKGIFIKDDIEEATVLVFDNLKKILEASGTTLKQVVKVTVFLRDMADFTAMNEVYGRYFPENQPARSCVAVKELPGNYPVEIELIAIK